jgi:hypothetical protein
MLIFINKNIYYIYIHIPKNGGKYIRNNIINDKKNKIIKSYWDVKLQLDLAHIPYMKKDDFVEQNIEYNYFTYTRCPYDRIISSYFYLNKNKNKNDFKNFIKTKLMLFNFSNVFHYTIIHYYPQYLFVCDTNLDIQNNIKICKLENSKKYNLSEYFDIDCINIINTVYSKDFLYFNYNMLTSI